MPVQLSSLIQSKLFNTYGIFNGPQIQVKSVMKIFAAVAVLSTIHNQFNYRANITAKQQIVNQTDRHQIRGTAESQQFQFHQLLFTESR